MNGLQTFIKAAVDRRAQEIILGPDRPIQFRIGRELINASAKELSSADSKSIAAQILTDDEKKSLFQDLKVQGIKNISGVQFKFDFQIDFSGITGSLQLENDVKRSWTFPLGVAESLMKPQGLHIISGPRRSGKSSAICDLLSQAKTRNRNIVCFVENENEILAIQAPNVAQFPIDQLDKNNIPRSADVVVIDTSSSNYCEKALQLAEQGFSVLLSLPAWNIEMALERFMDLSQGSSDSKARRLGAVLQWALACQLMPGLETPLCGAFELLTNNPDVQLIIKNHRLSQLSAVMNDKTEKLGMRTMNQSLFQLLIKRKIELKTAFEFSPSPEELDSILKKVGV